MLHKRDVCVCASKYMLSIHRTGTQTYSSSSLHSHRAYSSATLHSNRAHSSLTTCHSHRTHHSSYNLSLSQSLFPLQRPLKAPRAHYSLQQPLPLPQPHTHNHSPSQPFTFPKKKKSFYISTTFRTSVAFHTPTNFNYHEDLYSQPFTFSQPLILLQPDTLSPNSYFSQPFTHLQPITLPPPTTLNISPHASTTLHNLTQLLHKPSHHPPQLFTPYTSTVNLQHTPNYKYNINQKGSSSSTHTTACLASSPKNQLWDHSQSSGTSLGGKRG